MCDCLKKFEKEVKKHLNDEQAEIDWAMAIENSAFVTYPRLHATYRKQKNGVYTKKTFEHTIIPSYCPFCGKKYKKSGEKNEASKN